MMDLEDCLDFITAQDKALMLQDKEIAKLRAKIGKIDIIRICSEYYCVSCKILCHMYEQGLCCDCDKSWITEVYDETDYPSKWIRITVTIEMPKV